MPDVRRHRILLALLASSLLARATPVSGEDSSFAADALFRRATERFAQPSADSRQAALRDFEEALRLAPDRADIRLAYGEACLETGRFEAARSALSRAARHLPDAADAWSHLGSAWRHDWLATMDHSSLDEARKCFERAGALSPERAQVWTSVSALALLQGHPREALVAALRARQADPQGAEPLLALGAAFYRLSVLSFADSAFRAARGRLPPALLPRFDGDPAFEARPDSSRDSSSATARASGTHWQGTDPDLTTPENEAQLDYLTRLTLALFLFREGDEIRWDKRAELLLRYGPPSSVEYNPMWAQLEFLYNTLARSIYGAPPMSYPYNMQLWYYPELGMEVRLWDRSLTQTYQLPHSESSSTEPRPDPAALAAHPDLVALAGGRGVYRALVPGVKPMALIGSVARFPLADGTRLLAHVFARGGPGDSLSGTWALVAEDGRVVAGESHALAISSCDPERVQVGDFAANVGPGNYRLDLSVRAAGGRRGVAHLGAAVGPNASGLAMSDLVLLCGGRAPAVEPGGVRIEPNPRGRVGQAASLTVYYELERLAVGAGGVARFSYTCSVRPAADDEGEAPRAVYEVTRDEENVGTHRRQFVSVPLKALSAGAYELRLEVRDLIAGTTVGRTTRFVKD